MENKLIHKGILCIFLGALITVSQAQIVVKDYNKISSTYGAFTGPLNDMDYFGTSIVNWGDYNQDGVSDIAVGAPSDIGKGSIWILFLNADGTVHSDHQITEGSSGFSETIEEGALFGASLVNAGDLDQNGVNDLIVGSPNDQDKGSLSILFLDSAGLVLNSLKIGDLQGGFTGQLEEGDEFGSSLALLNDINNDGFDELLVGSVGDDDGFENSGAVWVLSLDSADTVASYKKISNTVLNNQLASQAKFGSSLFSNNSGFLSGSVGTKSLWYIQLDSSAMAKNASIISTSELEGYGSSLALVGDQDNNGIDDLAVGASGAPGIINIHLIDSAWNITNSYNIQSSMYCFSAEIDSLDRFGSSLSYIQNKLYSGAPSDNDGGTDRGAIYELIIALNNNPVADAGPDQTLECSGTLTEVILDGSKSSDADGDSLSFMWNGPLGELQGAVQVLNLPVGIHLFSLKVEDGCNGGFDTDSVSVVIQDTTPPEIYVSNKEIYLWPPNHKMHTIELNTIINSVFDLCDTMLNVDNVKIGSVTSDEPSNSNGDGNTEEDIIISDECTSVELRAERQGGENGRVYSINLWLQDASGNVGIADFQVMVPHDMGKGKKEIKEDSIMYEVIGCIPLPQDTTTHQSDTTSNDTDSTNNTNNTQEESSVSQNFPNPFSLKTKIQFKLVKAEVVIIEVYTLAGVKVREITGKIYPEGEHELTLDGSGLEPGIYIYHFIHGGKRVIKKMYLNP